ncbi:MAG: hypothetical protein KKH92_00275, partial [Firmicutes bacterium]|nr:hypothetical protein [Bacillota bacterium]
FINIVSYTNPNFTGELSIKIIYSTISLLLLIFDYASILFPKRLYKKDFSQYTTYVKISLYLGVIVIPLISLYYS